MVFEEPEGQRDAVHRMFSLPLWLLLHPVTKWFEAVLRSVKPGLANALDPLSDDTFHLKPQLLSQAFFFCLGHKTPAGK